MRTFLTLIFIASRTVTYTADPKEGFKAEVVREPTDIVVKTPTQAPQTEHQQQQQLFRQAPQPKQQQQQQHQQPEYSSSQHQHYQQQRAQHQPQQARPQYAQYEQ